MWRNLLFVIAFSLVAGVAEARKAEIDDDVMDAGEAEFDPEAALRARQEAKASWGQKADEQIPVDQQVLRKPWHKVPFGTRAFDLTPEQVRANWDTLMRGFRVPYPTAALMREHYERFPELRARHPQFDGDYERLERDLSELWRLFLRGDYQEVMQRGESLGPLGMLAGKVSQIFYAVYLEPDLSHKHMLLQDAANVIRDYGSTFDQMKKAKEEHYRNQFVAGRLAYVYSIGRIAEDVPIPVAIGRNYVFKVLGAIDDVNTFAPDNPLGIAARAGADANVVRKVGKATGRVTFGARQNTIRSDFERALATADLAVIRYEYANALLYLNKRRDIDDAIAQLRRAEQTPPRFAMEALDAMYASKRRREVEAWANSQASFRSFERKRLRYQKERNENLYCVLPGQCKPYLIN